MSFNHIQIGFCCEHCHGSFHSQKCEHHLEYLEELKQIQTFHEVQLESIVEDGRK